MRSSEQIDQLAAALAKAQAEIVPPTKDRTARVQTKTGGEYTFNYIGLDGIFDALRKPMADNSLSLSQGINMGAERWALTTRLMHGGGQWIESDYPISFDGSPQQRGSELTYARRYALCALLGIAAEDDDDGNAATGNRAETGQRQQRPQRQTQQKPNPPAEEVRAAQAFDETEKFLIRMREAFEARDFQPNEMAAAVSAVCTKKKIHLIDKLSGPDRTAFIQAIGEGRFDRYKAKEPATA